jgi:hypothetical protein
LTPSIPENPERFVHSVAAVRRSMRIDAGALSYHSSCA